MPFVRHFLSRALCLAILAPCLGGAAHAQTAAPAVVVTVKPIHSLVAAIMDGVALPDLIIPGAASPHSFTLRPSDARRIERAAVIIWVGEGLESFMRQPLAALGHRARIIALAEIPGLTLLKTRQGGAWETDAHDHGPKNSTGQDATAENDLHLWLDIGNARRLAAAVAGVLGDIDPGQAARYRANLSGLDARLAALDDELRKRLAPVRGKPFIVFHDAYHYFESRYGLAAAGSITVSPDRRPSAKRLREIRARIATSGARCVFREPQFAPKLVDTVIEGTATRIGVLDPLGAEIAPGPGAYFTIMRNLGENLIACLEQP